MAWFCKGATTAKKTYQRTALQFMGCYFVVLMCSSWFVKHDGAQHFFLYFWSVFPAIPIVGLIWRMGVYLREEKDEYQRLVTMQSILIGTGLLLAAVVINDFVRSFAGLAGLPPFWFFSIFCIGMGMGHAWMRFKNRAGADD